MLWELRKYLIIYNSFYFFIYYCFISLNWDILCNLFFYYLWIFFLFLMRFSSFSAFIYSIKSSFYIRCSLRCSYLSRRSWNMLFLFFSIPLYARLLALLTLEACWSKLFYLLASCHFFIYLSRSTEFFTIEACSLNFLALNVVDLCFSNCRLRTLFRLLTSYTFSNDYLKTPSAWVRVGKVFFEPEEASPSELINSDFMSAFCIFAVWINLINCLANYHFIPKFMRCLQGIYYFELDHSELLIQLYYFS